MKKLISLLGFLMALPVLAGENSFTVTYYEMKADTHTKEGIGYCARTPYNSQYGIDWCWDNGLIEGDNGEASSFWTLNDEMEFCGKNCKSDFFSKPRAMCVPDYFSTANVFFRPGQVKRWPTTVVLKGTPHEITCSINLPMNRIECENDLKFEFKDFQSRCEPFLTSSRSPDFVNQ